MLGAFGLDTSVYDLDEDAPEDGSVEDLAQARIGLLVGRTGLTEELQRVFEGLHRVVDLGDSLVLPALDLSLLSGDALLFGLEYLDRDGVAVVQLDELLLLGGQLTQATLVAFGFGSRVLSFAADELPDGLA